MEKKSLEKRLKELEDSIELLEEALEKASFGNKNYFKIISSQLRALLCSGGRSLSPLLINLASEKNIPLYCYGPSTRVSDTDEYTVLKISFFFIGIVPFSPASQKYELKDWMQTPFVRLGNEIYTPNDVIRLVAEKDGGAHYDSELPEKLLKLRGIIYSGQFKSVEERLLIQTTQATIEFKKNIFSS